MLDKSSLKLFKIPLSYTLNSTINVQKVQVMLHLAGLEGPLIRIELLRDDTILGHKVQGLAVETSITALAI